MIRLLLLAALLYVIWRIARYWWNQLTKTDHQTLQQPIPMLRCDHCQAHFPANEATRSEGKVFCSTSHLEDWRNGQ